MAKGRVDASATPVSVVVPGQANLLNITGINDKTIVPSNVAQWEDPSTIQLPVDPANTYHTSCLTFMPSASAKDMIEGLTKIAF